VADIGDKNMKWYEFHLAVSNPPISMYVGVAISRVSYASSPAIGDRPVNY